MAGRPKGSKNKEAEKQASELAPAELKDPGEADKGESEPDAAKAGEAGEPRVKRQYKKRAPKVRLELKLPPELVAQASAVPLVIAGQVVAIATDGQVALEFPPEALAIVATAAKAWLDSLGVDLSPGWALLAAYAMAFGMAAPRAVAQAKRASDAADKAKQAGNGTTAQASGPVRAVPDAPVEPMAEPKQPAV